MKDDSTGKPKAASIRAINAIREARSPDLKSPHKAVLYAIASRLNWKKVTRQGHPYAYPSYRVLAGDAGLSRSTCIKTVDALATKGFLIVGTRKGYRGTSNLYSINVTKLESLSPQNQQTPDDLPTPSTVRSKDHAHPTPSRPRPTDMSYQEYVERYQGQDPNAKVLQAFLKRTA